MGMWRSLRMRLDWTAGNQSAIFRHGRCEAMNLPSKAGQGVILGAGP